MVIGLMLAGLQGVVIGRVATGLFGAFVNMVLVRRLTGVTVAKQLWANVRALTSIMVMAAGVLLASRQMDQATGTTGLALQLAGLVSLGALLYCASTFLLWILMGRPAGPETEVQNILGKVLTRLRPA
jgi:hypothetical protein